MAGEAVLVKISRAPCSLANLNNFSVSVTQRLSLVV